MREVAWVVFDEVHYMRDKSRGVVWEETIILLPDKVHYVFLSATIPNAMEFAEWIVKIHNQPCHVVYTDFRPTPLQHYLFPAGGDGIHLVVDEKGHSEKKISKRQWQLSVIIVATTLLLVIVVEVIKRVKPIKVVIIKMVKVISIKL